MPQPVKPELLAPAGNLDCAWAALHYGADAVYLGMSRFSARADAGNFTPDSLAEVVGYAHQLQPRRRVYAAVNTLVHQAELPEAAAIISTLADLDIDGLIVQDAGILRLAGRMFPSLRLHASTQMACHSVDGAMALRRQGCSRVVLARELSIEEIRTIAAQAGVEIEVFVHGALCYSYSGLCLFSSHALGRSGNRGRCAYCCRDAFSLPGAKGRLLHPFSMKDLSPGGLLDEIAASGAASLKIEGRMKNPLYVAAVTDYFRRRLDGSLAGPDDLRQAEEDLQTIFSRPWTQLYMSGEAGQVIDPDTVGHRGAVIGRVAGIAKRRDGTFWLRFLSRRAVEKHDGIQIDIPGSSRPFGFSVAEMRPVSPNPARAGRGPVRLEAGREIELLLPDGHPAIPADSTVYCASSQAVKRRFVFERPRPGVHRLRRPISVAVSIEHSRMLMRGETVEPDSARAEVETAGPFTGARSADGAREAVVRCMDRLGATEWKAVAVDVANPRGLFVPVSVINGARRDLAARLTEARREKLRRRLAPALGSIETACPEPPPAHGGREETWSLKIRGMSVLASLPDGIVTGADEVVFRMGVDDLGDLDLLADALENKLTGARTRIALPAILREASAGLFREAVRKLAGRGFRQWEAANIGHTVMLDGMSLNVTADWPLYTLNVEAALSHLESGFSSCVLSPEDSRGNIIELLHRCRGRAIVPVFQYTPLFVSETPPAVPLDNASAKPENTRLTSRGVCYRAINDGRHTVVIRDQPFCLSDQLPDLRRAGASSFRVDCTYGPPDAGGIPGIWAAVRDGKTVPGTHMGNFDRGLM